jgi:Immunity protein 27
MGSPIAELTPAEVDLHGDWLVQQDRSVVADATEQRIEWLTAQKLERISNDRSGWETLYRDPRDGRLWELTNPQGGMQGGGLRRLHVLSRDEAAAKYSHAPI